MGFVDAHAHLDRMQDPARAVSEARAAGCLAIATCGYDLESSLAALRLAQAHPGFVFPVIGLAPTTVMRMDGGAFESALSQIKAHACEARAIGEIGLDFHWTRDAGEIALQKERFLAQLEFAVSRRIPVVIHSRKAEAEALDALESAGAKSVLLHFFSGKPEDARRAAGLGYSFTVPPAASRSRARTVAQMPLDSVMLESDSPFVGKTPCGALEAAPAVAKAKGISTDRVLITSTANAQRFYRIAAGAKV
jgi:TatD DNase family protein